MDVPLYSSIGELEDYVDYGFHIDRAAVAACRFKDDAIGGAFRRFIHAVAKSADNAKDADPAGRLKHCTQQNFSLNVKFARLGRINGVGLRNDHRRDEVRCSLLTPGPVPVLADHCIAKAAGLDRPFSVPASRSDGNTASETRAGHDSRNTSRPTAAISMPRPGREIK
jgi:hypothetical protein